MHCGDDDLLGESESRAIQSARKDAVLARMRSLNQLRNICRIAVGLGRIAERTAREEPGRLRGDRRGVSVDEVTHLPQPPAGVDTAAEHERVVPIARLD